MNMTKRVLVLLIAFVLVIGFTVGCFIYDDNERLIARTTGLRLGEGVEVVAMNKHGFPFRRSAYEAKISIPHDNPMMVCDALYEIYEESGGFYTYAEFYALCKEVFDDVKLRPIAENGTNVWALGVQYEDKENIFFVVVSQDPEHAYLYIYYSRY